MNPVSIRIIINTVCICTCGKVSLLFYAVGLNVLLYIRTLLYIPIYCIQPVHTMQG